MYIMTKRRRKGNKKRGTRKLFKFIKNRRQRINQRGRKFRRTFRKRRKQLNLRFRSLRRGGGGGKIYMATAGGKNISKISDIFDFLSIHIMSILTDTKK